ncbi:MAG: acyltransferase, partial [Sulfuricella sp.]|nr:acyltransferase [Sulfuricella sp.]
MKKITLFNLESSGEESYQQITPSSASAVDTLRALAIIFVVLHHLLAYGGINFPVLGEIGGVLGVQLFFLVSGFLIIQSAEKYSLPVFAIHRFFRIFPPYLAIYFTVLIARLVFGDPIGPVIRQHTPWLLLNALNLQFLHPVSVLLLDVLHVGWSLTVELGWYLLAPLVVYWSGGRLRNWLAILALGWIVSVVWVLAGQNHLLDFLYLGMFATAGVSLDAGIFREAIVTNAPPAQMAYFITGACLYRFSRPLSRLPLSILWLIAALILPFLVQWHDLLGFRPNPISAIGLSALFLWVTRVNYGDALTSWLARTSFSIYLVHVPLLRFVFEYLKPNIFFGLILALTL